MNDFTWRTGHFNLYFKNECPLKIGDIVKSDILDDLGNRFYFYGDAVVTEINESLKSSHFEEHLFEVKIMYSYATPVQDSPFNR